MSFEYRVERLPDSKYGYQNYKLTVKWWAGGTLVKTEHQEWVIESLDCCDAKYIPIRLEDADAWIAPYCPTMTLPRRWSPLRKISRRGWVTFQSHRSQAFGEGHSHWLEMLGHARLSCN
jgi:hypothetical protein